MRSPLASFRRAWAIRPVAAGEFYSRTGWSLLGIAAGFLGLLFLPVWFGDAEWPAYDPLLSIPLAVIPICFFIVVFASLFVAWAIKHPAAYHGNFGYEVWGRKTFLGGTMPMRLECRIITICIVATAVLVTVCHLWFDNQNSNAVSYYWAVLALVTSCLLGGLAWYRHQIVSGDLLVIPDDWPE